MIRFITLFIGAFLAVMIAIQEIGPYFITDIEFPQNELIITLGVAIGSLLVVVLPRVAMVVFVTVACYSALQVQLGAEDNLYIYASAAAILTIMSYMSFLSLRRDKKRLKKKLILLTHTTFKYNASVLQVVLILMLISE